MWSLRRASYALKRQGYWLGDCRAFAAVFDIVNVKGDTANICKPTKWSSDRCISSNEFIKIQRACEDFSIGRFSFCSQAGAESSSQSVEDLEEGVSELGTPTKTENIEDTNAEDEDGEDLISAPELSDDDMTKTSRNDIDLSDIDMGVTGVDSQTKKVCLELFNAIVAAPDQSTHSALNKWVEEGKDLERAELNRTIITLRKHRMYWKALELPMASSSSFRERMDKAEQSFRERIAKAEQDEIMDMLVRKIGFPADGNFPKRQEHLNPDVKVGETDEATSFEMELKYIKKSDVMVEVEGGSLIVKCHTPGTEEEEHFRNEGYTFNFLLDEEEGRWMQYFQGMFDISKTALKEDQSYNVDEMMVDKSKWPVLKVVLPKTAAEEEELADRVNCVNIE